MVFFQVVVEGLDVGRLEVADIARQQVGGRVEFEVSLKLVCTVKSLIAHLQTDFLL